VKDGLVKSLNRPGGNVTGSHVFTTSLGPKRLELLRELVPKAKVIGLLVNPSSQVAEVQVKEVAEAARTLGQQIRILNANTAEEIEQVFAGFVQRDINAVLISAGSFFQVQRDQLVALAARHSLPVMYESPEFVRAGGLISYSTFRDDAFLQTGIYVGRILNGAKPTELPVVQSTRFALVINLKTARALDLEVPAKLLGLADEVVE
jgi:putative ABC transport system substrate-binding protein